jgi:septation ring formation regulator EzrA
MPDDRNEIRSLQNHVDSLWDQLKVVAQAADAANAQNAAIVDYLLRLQEYLKQLQAIVESAGGTIPAPPVDRLKDIWGNRN